MRSNKIPCFHGQNSLGLHNHCFPWHAFRWLQSYTFYLNRKKTPGTAYGSILTTQKESHSQGIEKKFARHLNFINRAIVPGRAFTRRMYAKFSGIKDGNMMLKQHHHVKLDKEFKMDCKIWEMFLQDISSITRPFVDMSKEITADELFFYSDASAKEDFSYGAVFGNRWIFGRWQENFIQDYEPSIKFLELFALCAAIFTWQDQITRARVIVFCDNISVVHMVNKLTSSCGQCMKLIRLLTLNNLKWDRRIFIRHIEGRKNILSDALSRPNLTKFFKYAPKTIHPHPDNISEELWPLTKIWDAEVIGDWI